jgi:uroporphyrinogen decarboxylase
LAQIAHRETRPVPYTLGFEGDVAERLDAHYGSARWRALLDNAIRHVPGPSALGVNSGAGPLVRDAHGTTWRVDRRPWHLAEPAIKEPSLKGFDFPSMDTVFDTTWEPTAHQALAEGQDHFWVTGLGFGLFERTWALRGFTEALADAAAEPSFYDELVEAVAVHQMAVIERLLELPVDGIMFSDDWGYQQGVLLGPARWRRFIKPRLARMYALVHAAGKLTLSHCCGSIPDLFPDLIEIGLDVIESVQPEARGMDPYALKREYGQDITFWGGLGSQSTIPFGTPAEIKAEVARLCREMGQGGGYILTSSKGLQPETPTENAAAVVEAFLAEAGVAL